MRVISKAALATVVLAAAAQANAEVTFYQGDNFQGRAFTSERRVPNLDRFGFNDRASSVAVTSERWEVCDDVRFSGRCVVLRPGQYPTLAAMGLNDGVSSARAIGRDERIDKRRYAPTPAPAPQKSLFTSVKALADAPLRPTPWSKTSAAKDLMTGFLHWS